MDWLTTYTKFEIPNIVSTINDYQQHLSSFDDTIDRLDNVLDIWSCPPDAWSDLHLIKWAGIFNSTEQSKRDGTPLSEAQRVQIDEAMARLKHRAQNVYCTLFYEHALQEIAAYEQGRLHLGTLAGRTFFRLADDVEGYVPDGLYTSLFNRADALEVGVPSSIRMESRRAD